MPKPERLNSELIYRLAMGQALRGFRERQGLNQTEVAAAAGISQPGLNRIETGQRSPTAFELKKFTEYLSSSPAEAYAVVDDFMIRLAEINPEYLAKVTDAEGNLSRKGQRAMEHLLTYIRLESELE